MRKRLLLKSLLSISLLFTCVPCYAQEPITTQFRLSGEHTFTQTEERLWQVAQELIDEKTGEIKKTDSFAEDKGSRVKFNLPKVKNQETIYHIVTNGNGDSQKYTVQVFEPNKVSSFHYKTKLNPPIRTFIFVPKSLSPNTKVIFVMHGMSRTAFSYIKSWNRWAEKNDHIVIATKFDKKHWKGSRRYNLGNMFTRKGHKRNRSKWTFQIVENLFSEIKEGFRLKTNYYDIFGHSAGGQFVNRFMLFMPETKVRFAFAANPGWYTVPDLDLKYPYGLKHKRLNLKENDLLRWSKKRLFLLRGTNDTNRTSSLRQTKEADAQGKNRFERAGFMFEKIKSINTETNWKLINIPDVAHNQKGMAIAAQDLLDMLNAKTPQN